MRKPVLSSLLSIVILLIGFFSMFNGKGFAAQWNTSPDIPFGVTFGDWDNDGFNEIAFARIDAGTVNVYDRFGSMISQWAGLSWPRGVAIGDYDNDGLNDLAFTEQGAGRVSVYRYPGDPPNLIYQWAGFVEPQYVAIGDCDNDGLNELAFSDRSDMTVSVWKPTPPNAPYLMWEWAGLYEPQGVAIGDYDNDGLNELAYIERSMSTVSVWKWPFTNPPLSVFSGGGAPSGVAIGDYDNCGLNEIAFAETWGQVTVLYPALYPGYPPIVYRIVPMLWPAQPWSVAIGDYNADGYKDLAWTDSIGEKVIVYRWGDLGSPVGVTPTFYAYDDKVDWADLALFIECYKGLAPPEAIYLADIGGPVGVTPTFYAFDGKVDWADLALFIACYKGNGP